MAAKKQVVPRQESIEAIKTVLKDYCGDGWIILKPEYLIKSGFSWDFVSPLVYTEKTNKRAGPKGQLYDNDGNPVDKITGVYTLTMWYAIANNIGADTTEASNKSGRGFQAQCLAQAITQKLGLNEEK